MFRAFHRAHDLHDGLSKVSDATDFHGCRALLSRGIAEAYTHCRWQIGDGPPFAHEPAMRVAALRSAVNPSPAATTRRGGFLARTLPGTPTHAILAFALFAAVQLADAHAHPDWRVALRVSAEANPLIASFISLCGPIAGVCAAKAVAIVAGAILHAAARYLALVLRPRWSSCSPLSCRGPWRSPCPSRRHPPARRARRRLTVPPAGAPSSGRRSTAPGSPNDSDRGASG